MEEVHLSPYERAFGLVDNPFNPSSFPGVQDPGLLQELSSWPLRLDDESALQPLFVEAAEPFERPFTGMMGS